MKIATYNINNVNRRLPNLLAWLKQAKPDSLIDPEGLLDPAKCWAAMMANEKPGGHGRCQRAGRQEGGT